VQPARIAGGQIKVKVKPAPSSTEFPTAFPRAPISHGQSTVQPGSTKPVIKQKTVTVDKIKQKSIPETRILSNSTGSKRKQTSCSIDRQPAKRAKTDARIPAISLNGFATQGQINQAVRCINLWTDIEANPMAGPQRLEHPSTRTTGSAGSHGLAET
jgi:hypothetical protein